MDGQADLSATPANLAAGVAALYRWGGDRAQTGISELSEWHAQSLIRAVLESLSPRHQ